MIHSLRQYLLAFLTLFFFNTALPQGAAPNQEFKPKDIVHPKSPAVDGLYQYSQFPIDHSSGAVNIDIPVHTIKSGRIELPVSISYHTSGIKVQDIASEIGLGWNLNFGYSVQVSEEETKIYPYSIKRYKNTSSALAATNINEDWLNEMKNSADGYYPSRHTIYQFSCANLSGTFFYNDSNQLQFLSADDNVKIEAINYSETASVMGGFKITTADGIQYLFDKRETSLRMEQSYPGPSLQTTAFWVSKITDLITGDVVNFTYTERDPYFTYAGESYSRTYLTRPTGDAQQNCDWEYPDWSHPNYAFKTNALQISYIGSTSGGGVEFSSVKDRLDMDKTRISGIRIYSPVTPNSLVKSIQFNQSYFISGGSMPAYNYRLKLDSMTISSSASPTFNIQQNTYRFEYDPTELPAYRDRSSGSERNSLRVDYWGFYNGSYGGTGLIPSDVLQEFLTGYGLNGSSNFSTDRKANPIYTKAGILNKIVYPTGGYARFEYENHKLPGYYLGATLGGLRVKSIVYSADSNDVNPIKKTFKYLSAKEMTPASMQMFSYNKGKQYVTANCARKYKSYYISSDPLYPIVYHHGSPVFYDKVEETEGDALRNSGKTLYSFLYTGTLNNEYAAISINEYGGMKFMHNKDWTRGQLLSKEVYTLDNNYPGSYRMVSKEVNTYRGFSKPEALLGMLVSKFDRGLDFGWDLVGSGANDWYVNLLPRNVPQFPGTGGYDDVRLNVTSFTYNDIRSSVYYYKLSKQEVYRYTGADNVYSSTDYYYDSTFHQQVTKRETQDSQGNINTAKYYYVQDASQLDNVNLNESGTAFPLLRQYNFLNDVIQEDQLVNGKLKLRKRARYTFRYNNELSKNIPVIQQYITTHYNAEEAVSKTDLVKNNLYDNHSLVLEKQDGEGILSSYIWDDSGINLLASVENAAYTDVFQTSFEYGGKGRWTYSGGWNGVGDSDADAMTGSRSATLSGRQMTASGLSASKEYVVSYWSTNGSYTIPGSTGITEGRNVSGVNNWKYYEHRVTGVSSVTISGTGKIDEVRLFPKDAQLTSYTHTPVIGVNTICDANGKILYYSYDGLGRLVMIRDLDKNVVKRFCYKFYDQPENCTESYN
jgi:YD repeat-containing protein